MADLAIKNKERWDNMKISAEDGPKFKAVADRLLFQKPRYEAVSNALKQKGYDIPWQFIAVTHQREGSGDFTTYLGNGQKLNKVTTIVPKGRGPFTSWEEGAIDALVYAPPYAAKNKDWSIGGTLAKIEEYNGLGYYQMGRPSPYVWAGTDQYVSGKYIADHKYDPNYVDKQLGCAGLLKFMGYGKATAPTVFATSVAATAAVTASVTFWDTIQHHLPAYGLGAAAVIGICALMIYAHNHKDDNVKYLD